MASYTDQNGQSFEFSNDAPAATDFAASVLQNSDTAIVTDSITLENYATDATGIGNGMDATFPAPTIYSNFVATTIDPITITGNGIPGNFTTDDGRVGTGGQTVTFGRIDRAERDVRDGAFDSLGDRCGR